MKKMLAAIIIPLLLSACATQPQRTDSAKLSVAASFYPLAYIMEKVGGEHVDVLQITPSGVEPHDYEPTPQELVALQSAKLVLLNGSGLDPWAEKARNDLTAKGIIVLTATEEVELLPNEEEEEHGAFDPHIWLDPLNMQRLVERTRDALIQIDPAHEKTYRSKADAFLTRLTSLDTAFREGLASCEIRELVTSHNAFNYLARRYDLTMIPITISPEDEPSPMRMAEIAEIAKEKKIDTIFFEALVSPKLSQTIASEIGAKTAVLNPIEGLTEAEQHYGETYVSLMEENLSNLRAALRCP